MKFNIPDYEVKNILEMHSKLKKNKVVLVEQTAPAVDPDETTLRNAIKAGCLTNGGLKKDKTTGKILFRKVSTSKPGAYIYFYGDMSYKFSDGSKSGKWKCDGITKIKPEDPKIPELTPRQQKSVDDLINFYKQDNGEPLYQKEEPTADQIAKKEWEKINLKDEEGFKDIIKFDYFVWKKTGLRQTQSPQQKNIINTYVNAGWSDIGGSVNPAEADKYITIDLKDEYSEEFPESYKLVKLIKSVDIDVLIKELNDLVNTNNYRDRKTCKDIIEKYSAAKDRKAYVDNAVLRNWKIAVNACIANDLDYRDIGVTKGKIEKLKTPAQDATSTSGTTGSTSGTTGTTTPAKKDKWAL